MEAVRQLGPMGAKEELWSMLQKESAQEVKPQIVTAMFVAGDAEHLVAIARKETDPAVKRDVVSKLSLMTKSKVAMDYLMEILNK